MGSHRIRSVASLCFALTLLPSVAVSSSAEPTPASQDGWSLQDNSWVFTRSGHILQGWFHNRGSWYWADSEGRAVLGWKHINSSWYYFNSSNAMVTGWQSIGGKWYYFTTSGAMQTGWLHNGNTWYYLDSSGTMSTGWNLVNNTWYYFTQSGEMKTGWVDNGSTWYFFNSSGAMATGWRSVNGTWYYFETSGAMKTGWLENNGTWYYLAPSGAMVTGQQDIDSATYYFASDGRWFTPTPIMGAPQKNRATTIQAMLNAYAQSGHSYPSSALSIGGAPTALDFFSILYDEAIAEGINPEVVFAQSMLETAWLSFGGDVKIQQFNFAGLAATGNGAQGNGFPDVRTGLRAQVQHLRAYADPHATVSSLSYPLVDQRFDYVVKGSAPIVEYLGIQENPQHRGWATGKNYGFHIIALMKRSFS